MISSMDHGIDIELLMYKTITPRGTLISSMDHRIGIKLLMCETNRDMECFAHLLVY